MRGERSGGAILRGGMRDSEELPPFPHRRPHAAALQGPGRKLSADADPVGPVAVDSPACVAGRS